MERVEALFGTTVSLEPAPSVAAAVDERWPGRRCQAAEVLAINGCSAMPDALREALGELSCGEEIRDGEHIAAARCTMDALRAHVVEGAPLGSRSRDLSEPVVAATPWRALDLLPTTLAHDLATMIARGAVSVGGRRADLGDHAVDISPGATICPGVILDASHGSIVVAEGATIRPGAILIGPCAVLAGAWVAENAVLKSNTVIGPRCKVGGEVGSFVMQANSNKVHHGFLGDCLVGEWVNIGAGATGSNLLNTYGEVVTRLDPSAGVERTGRAFYGGLIADHAKIGIQCAVATGSSIGTGAMVACDRPPACVDRFSWLTPERSARFRWDRFEQTMRAVMARRGAEPGAAVVERLRSLHATGEAA